MLFDDTNFLQPVEDKQVNRLDSKELERLARVEKLQEVRQLGLGLSVGSMSEKQLKGASEQNLFWAS